jgi:outer membrane lipoprotein-sorting protein
MRVSIIWMLFLLSTTVFAQNPDPDMILSKVDQNIIARNRISEAEMIIRGRHVDRTVRSISWIKGTETAFTEYLAPPRERGTKMLKQKDNLWTYFPRTDRTVSIAGHLLNQSIMGSDLSYSDLMEDPKLQNIYNAKIVGEETLLDRRCWILDLVAKEKEVSYYKRKIWVDKERFIVLKENRYALSGRLIKTTEVKKIEKIDGRWVPVKIIFKDQLKTGEGTEFNLISIKFNDEIPDYVFTKANLKK